MIVDNIVSPRSVSYACSRELRLCGGKEDGAMKTARAYTLLELLIGVGVVLLLLVATGNVIVATLHVQALHADRALANRSAGSLELRLQEEARSSTAVFLPAVDVMGGANDGPQGAHEVDFMRVRSDGGNVYVAYVFNPQAQTVTRYDYSLSASGKTILDSDAVAADIGAFDARREGVVSTGLVAGQPDPAQVTILYGRPEVKGGNDVVVVNIGAVSHEGEPPILYSVHLASRAAPTSLAVLAPASGPSQPPGGHRTIPFFILRPGFPVSVPHGPMHGGSPGGPPSLLHWIAAEGSFNVLGPGNPTWLQLTSLYPTLTSGTYVIKNSDGSTTTLLIDCTGAPCPTFRPIPLSLPGGSQGTLYFELASSR
jgi:type II secretory pathway pseudopilin PulG